MKVPTASWEQLAAALEEALTMLHEGEVVQVFAVEDVVRLTWQSGHLRAELLSRDGRLPSGWRRSGGRVVWTAPDRAPLPPSPRNGSLAQTLSLTGRASGGEARALALLRRKCGQARAAELAVVGLLRDEHALAVSQVSLDVPVPDASLWGDLDEDEPPWDEDEELWQEDE